ncbi:MAG: hypothetical protein M5R36_26400 [Deltaproteobacteria bacterium]|nr:hypothetical protein [Deltaproteobacteria bacterium]
MGTMLKGQDIVCVASSNWDAMWVNAQHLMHRLSVENRVLYLDNMGLRLPGASAADLGKVAARVRSWFRPPRRASATLWVVTPIVLPFHRNGFVRMLNRWLLTRRIKRVMRDMGMGRPILWSFLPTAADLVGCLGEAGVVYQCVDDYAANPGVPAETIRAQERRMEAFADVTIVTSPALRDAKKDRARYLLYSPNAADVPRFRDAKPALPDGLAAAAGGRRIIGYHGNVSAYKTDIPLLERVAREFRNACCCWSGRWGGAIRARR